METTQKPSLRLELNNQIHMSIPNPKCEQTRSILLQNLFTLSTNQTKILLLQNQNKQQTLLHRENHFNNNLLLIIDIKVLLIIM